MEIQAVKPRIKEDRIFLLIILHLFISHLLVFSCIGIVAGTKDKRNLGTKTSLNFIFYYKRLFF